MARSTQQRGRTLRGVRRGVLFTLSCSLAACAATGGSRLPSSDPEDGAGPRTTGVRNPVTRVPEWAGRPLSWEKLESINAWLATDARASAGYWVAEGHLQLSEGRLSFARREPADSETRMRDAQRGFQRVLSHPNATASQRQRAELGLADVDRGAPSAPSNGNLPGIVPRARWGARAIVTYRLNAAQGNWRYITIHHSVHPDAASTDGSLASSAAAIRRIQDVHMNNEGYGDVGYHFLIDPSGRIFQGRDLRWRGAHAGGLGGANNYGNIGICLIGNFEVERPTQKALDSMHALVAHWSDRFDIPPSRVAQHSDWKNTACPGEFLRRELARYR